MRRPPYRRPDPWRNASRWLETVALFLIWGVAGHLLWTLLLWVDSSFSSQLDIRVLALFSWGVVGAVVGLILFRRRE